MITAEEVQILMQCGGWATLRLRANGPQTGYRTASFGPTLDDPHESYGYNPVETQRPPPSIRDITLMDEVATWLRFVDDDRVRRVVAMRMLYDEERGRCIHSYRRIGMELRTSAQVVSKMHRRGLATIARFVNKDNRLLSKICLYLADLERA